METILNKMVDGEAHQIKYRKDSGADGSFLFHVTTDIPEHENFKFHLKNKEVFFISTNPTVIMEEVVRLININELKKEIS